ncbi:hypothetical protein [Bradyrhizobium sp.]|uniref:hypothetical protein n=1 Tax=Bradyrhizobium sp. TaxID=376 RepID=UPI002D1FBEAE|nr:hypothetical protein [Bradyrhizobium sp.]
MIHILKQVMMDRFVVFEVHRSVRQRFFCPGAGNFGFKSVKLGLITQVELVHQHG